MAKAEDKDGGKGEVKTFDPEEVRKAFGALRGRVTRLENRLAGTDEVAKRARDIAHSAEHRADDCRLDCHAAEVKATTCKLDMDSSWRFLQKALEDIVALRGRVRMLENANGATAGGDPKGSDGGDEHRDTGADRPGQVSDVGVPGS